MPATDFKSHPRGPYIVKDPAAKLDYAVDWAAWLGEGDTLVAAAWSAAPAGLILSDPVRTPTTAATWIEGGAAGSVYVVTCAVETALGRRDERSFRLIVEER